MTDFSWMETLELILRWFFVLQMLFAGINGIFHLRAVPPSGPKIDDFVKACIDVKFIMPTVKVLEIVGALIMINKAWTPLALILFAPMMFVISLLHALHNPKPWAVLLTFSLPYVLLIYLHHEKLMRALFA